MKATGYVLAGGLSRRMGSDKAFLEIGDSKMIECVIQRIRPHVGRLFIIGNRLNVPALRSFPVDGVLTDYAAGYGPMMGLYTGLMHSQTSLNLFVTCDMPRIHPELLKNLLKAWREGTDVVAGQSPEGFRYFFPIVCHVTACCTVGSLLDRRTLALHELLREARTVLVTIEDADAASSLVNINAPADAFQLCDERSILRE